MQSLRQIRRQRGLTQEQLGAAVGCTGTFVSQIERGVCDPSVALLRRIAKALHTSVDTLLAEGTDKASSA